jgi:hypothetical protein
MRKQIIALLAAILITGTIAMSMLVIGANALINQNGTPVSNAPVLNAAPEPSTASSTQSLIDQLQAQVSQYQARGQQYRSAADGDND